MSSLSVSCQQILTQERSLQITMKSSSTKSPMLILSLKFVVRLESPGPSSQLPCSQSQSYIATEGQSVIKSWCRALSGARDQICITLWQLRSSFCGAPSLTWGRVCLLYVLLVLASAVFLGSESLETRGHILLSRFETFPFVASYDSQGHGGGIRPRLHAGYTWASNLGISLTYIVAARTTHHRKQMPRLGPTCLHYFSYCCVTSPPTRERALSSLHSNGRHADRRKHSSCIAGPVHAAGAAQQWVDTSQYKSSLFITSNFEVLPFISTGFKIPSTTLFIKTFSDE
jgi:hypothetical protein